MDLDFGDRSEGDRLVILHSCRRLAATAHE